MQETDRPISPDDLPDGYTFNIQKFADSMWDEKFMQQYKEHCAYIKSLVDQHYPQNFIDHEVSRIARKYYQPKEQSQMPQGKRKRRNYTNYDTEGDCDE